MAQGPWPEVAELLRAQRKLARLSLRTLARMADVSDSYLSQVERGIYQPSPEILKSIADSLGVPVAPLYERLGWLGHERPAEGDDASTAASSATSVEEAIAADPRLSPERKATLLQLYRTLVDD